MSGTIIENLSNRKVFVVISLIFLIQIISFFIGGFLAPLPSNVEQILSIKCLPIDKNLLSIPRTFVNDKIQPSNCLISEKSSNQSIVFALQMPLPKDGVELDYSRWMSNLLVLFYPEIIYDERLKVNNNNEINEIKGTLVMNVKLAAKNSWEKDWKVYYEKKNLKKNINCYLNHNEKKTGDKYDCDVSQFFELQSIFYDYYLVNLELLGEQNGLTFSGVLSDMNFVTIHQNGGFTKIWCLMKIFFFLITFSTLIWFKLRIQKLRRHPDLIESSLFFLGFAITQYNLPIEYLNLYYDLPFMNFLNDIRQGILYCTLLCFWLIFTGEHLLDNKKSSQLSNYYLQISVVMTGSISLFIFDSAERGVQAFDPFFSIWETGSNLAVIFILLAGLAITAYLIFLGYHVYCVFNIISCRQISLPAMSSTRRLFYQGVIYRFKFLLLATIVCAVSTSIFFFLSQTTYGQSNMHDQDYEKNSIQWTSAFFTTVYAMWNCYIIILLIFYAPSKKCMDVDNSSEEIEFSRLTENSNDETEENLILRNKNSNETNSRLLQELTKERFE